MTQGDVNGAIGMVVGTGATLWAAQIATTVLFPQHARRAAEAVRQSPQKTLGFGALVGITGGALGLILSNIGNGVLSLIGLTLLVCLLAVSVLGGAGISLIAGERIEKMDARLSPLSALGRGAGLLIAAGFLPVVGWFFLFPLLLLTTIGAGVRALQAPKPVTAPTPASAPVQS